MAKMHDDEVHIDGALVQRLMTDQFPALADLPISPVPSTGTMNAIYRVGDDLYARLPRIARGVADLERERRWLPWLAPQLPLAIPAPVGEGRSDESYPFAWALYRWLDGQNYSDECIDDEAQAAGDLARFVLALRRLDPAGAPRAGRRPLRQLDAQTRAAIAAAREVLDVDAALAAWDDAIDTSAWNGDLHWIHTDLLRPNILTRSGRISAVIDFGAAGVGDPAADLIAAWSVFGPVGREVFRSLAGIDRETWRRARGFALHQAALIIPYYATTNPGFVALARRTVQQVLLDVQEHR
jgi:aminoglycoside phosphotransferase (APT) family kinase protein